MLVNDYNSSTQGRGGPETGGSLDSQGCSLEKLRAGFAALQESTKHKALLSPAPPNPRERRQDAHQCALSLTVFCQQKGHGQQWTFRTLKTKCLPFNLESTQHVVLCYQQKKRNSLTPKVHLEDLGVSFKGQNTCALSVAVTPS